MTQLHAHSTGDQKVASLILSVQNHSFMESYHEIFSAIILSHLQIQEEQFSFSGERNAHILVNSLED